MRLVVTRPALDAAPLAAQLQARGHEVAIEPMMTVRFLTEALPVLDGIAALLVTSANGVRAFIAASERRDIPAYAVGAHTATTLREAGFGTVETAEGDSAALARLVTEKRRPDAGRLLHIAGTELAGDLAGTLEAAGFRIGRARLYEAAPVDRLGTALQADLAAGKIDGVLLFSPRTARLFVTRLAEAGLADSARHLTAWCLSPAVAEALDGAGFADRQIADRPTQDALLTRIHDAMLSSPAPNDSGSPKKDDSVSATPPPSTTIDAPGLPPGSTPPAAEAPRRDRTMIYIGIGVVALALIGGATSPFWADYLPWAPKPPPEAALSPPATPPETASAPESPPEAAAPPAPPATVPAGAIPMKAAGPQATTAPMPAADDALKREVDQLGQRLAALEAHPGADRSQVQGVASDEQKLAASVTALDDRLGKLEAAVQGINRQAAADKALILLLGELRAQLAGSGPYDTQISAITAIAGGDAGLKPAIAMLRSHAKTGLPSLSLLASRLTSLAPALTIAPETAGAPWWRRYLIDPVLHLVRISRVPVDGNIQAMPAGPDRVLAEAQAALAKGDLAGAVQLVGSLDGRATATVRPWLDQAQARLDAEAAVQQLTAAVTARLAAGAAP